MARKLAASVLSKVVGVRLEALERFRTGLTTLPPSGLKAPPDCGGGGGLVVEETAVLVVATTVESESKPELWW